MTYKGKTVIRMVGRIVGREQCGIIVLEYADHTTERILLELRTERGRRIVAFASTAEEKSENFPSIYNMAWRTAS